MRAGSKIAKAVKKVIKPGKKVNKWEISTYGDLKSRPGRAGMDMDHIPSKASLLKAAEKRKGGPLTAAEAKRVTNEGNAMAVPRRTHQTTSRTYGGRNKADVVAHDAADPLAATRLDVESYRAEMRRQGLSDEAIDGLADELLRRNGRR